MYSLCRIISCVHLLCFRTEERVLMLPHFTWAMVFIYKVSNFMSCYLFHSLSLSLSLSFSRFSYNNCASTTWLFTLIIVVVIFARTILPSLKINRSGRAETWQQMFTIVLIDILSFMWMLNVENADQAHMHSLR